MENVETRPSAARIATDAVIEEDMANVFAGGESRFPNGVHFIAADLATPRAIARAAESSPMVVVIDGDRSESWIQGRNPGLPAWMTDEAAA
ncbi:hypothetical protein Q5424_18050 [Conexibacter sp. JD483]|uniref:hypothetical protein n=1 Tax=unclassified Conexibacter TaxID=2627773 RepID=UPI0027253650|nr:MULTISPECIES: hypothetical protein [unclassified Conexibacter]MDO8188281.1 hypothetical protein [Conexibacter sp. CPCC 205706]MDO8198961.1 hypothetical protein [Conexibacter sp. CPCC 205762]MDR9371005.1 hypothetical protein [Conexibacter sp. JD483]